MRSGKVKVLIVAGSYGEYRRFVAVRHAKWLEGAFYLDSAGDLEGHAGRVELVGSWQRRADAAEIVARLAALVGPPAG